MDSNSVLYEGDKVTVNSKGMEYVREGYSQGRFTEPIPETLVGVVLGYLAYYKVRLPLTRRELWGEETNVWLFNRDELTK